MKKIRDGLDRWHYEFCRSLLVRLLARKPIDIQQRVQSRHLLALLASEYQLSEARLGAVVDLLSVTRSRSGISFLRSVDGRPTELAVNYGGIEQYEQGGEFTEYASYAADPVIGSRWVQNPEEALMLTLGHELAHYVVALMPSAAQHQPHGDMFKQVYRLIRGGALNPMLDEFAQDEKQRAAARLENRLIKKITALRKLSSDTTSNEHEAERALIQLQALMAKHGLDDSVGVGKPKLHVVERTVPVLKRDNYKPVLHVAWAISQFCGVESVVHRQVLQARTAHGVDHRFSCSSEYVSYFGAAADVAMAVYTSELLYHALFADCDTYRSSETYRRERLAGHHHRALVSAFRRAFVDRINARLLKARHTVEAEWAESVANGRALMAKKDAELTALFKRRYPKLSAGRALSSVSGGVSSALGAGQDAANRVNLNRPTERDIRLALPRK